MSEPSLFELFRSRWLEIARQLWPKTPREQLQGKLLAIDAELGRRQSRLLLCRKRIEKLHDRLKRREHRLALAAASVQEIRADAGAIAELERQQRAIERLRERLEELEGGYVRRLARWRQRKQKWTELREELLSGSLPKQIDDESDPDYPF